MNRGKKILLITVMAALAALVVGVGYALAQDTTGGQDQQALPGSGEGWRKGDCARGAMMAGEVIKVENNTITFKNLKGEEKSVKVDDQTVYRKAPDGEASLDDVKPGEKVALKLTRPQEGEEQLARAVIIGELPAAGLPGKFKRHGAVGDVVSVDGNKVTVRTPDGDKEFTLPEITEGSRIGVMTDPDGNVRGLLYNPPERPGATPEGQPQSSTQSTTVGTIGGQNA